MLLFSFRQQLTQPQPNSQDDLLHLFKTFGQPSEKLTWIFNGDLVDRGDHACEIVLLIFALKLKHPKFVFINRGNHEEPHINIYSGFEEECMAKYDHRVFQMFHAAFVWLPYACLVNGKTLVLHGGLPRDETVSVNDIRNIARGPDVCSEKHNMGNEEWIRDVLWSDPHHDPEFLGYELSSRGAGVLWGKDATHRFLDKEGLAAMVRSHQCVQNGVEAAHDGRVYTVFSASNYCGTSGNLGAAVVFSHGDEKPTQVYQWDQSKLSSIAGQVITSRQSREQKRLAAVRQAAEYIVENKTALMEYYRKVDSAATGVVSFFEWAKGLATVLQVRLAWQKLVSGLVSADDMDASCDGVRYDRWLQRFTVELKGGCKEWQEEVVGKISAAVLQSGGDLVRAFKEIDTDASGEISNEEFKVAVRTRLPSLAVLSDVQLDAVVNAFDADGSGQVDVHEFADMLKRHIARSIQKSTKGADLDVVGLQWHTKAEPEQAIECETPKTGLERVLADAVAQLFFTHRRELFHIWHTYFDVEKKGSISADEFVRSVQALDTEGGTGMLSDGSLRRLVEVLDTNGDGRIDFMEFSRNIGSLVERVHGNPPNQR